MLAHRRGLLLVARSSLRFRAEPKYPATEWIGGFRRRWPFDQPGVEVRPCGLKSGTDHQQRVGPQGRFVGRYHHHAGRARDVEIAQQRPRMHMVDHAAELRGKADGGARAVHIGPQPGDQRQPACFQQFRRFGRGSTMIP